MRKGHILMSWVIVGLFLFSALAGLSARGDTEPNDSFDTAETMSVNTPVTGNVDSSGDMDDYYKVNIPAPPAGKSYSVNVSLAFDSGVDFDLYVYDADENSLGYSWYDNPEVVVFLTDTGGTYYILVEAYSGSGAYTLRATTSEVTSDGNNNFDSAEEKHDGDTVNSDVNKNTDPDDYYKIQLTVSGNTADMLNVTLTVPDTSTVLNLVVYDPSKEYVDEDLTNSYYYGTGPTISINAVATTTGYYYVRVACVNSDSGTYTLHFAVAQVQTDGNNDAKNATALTPNVPHTETINTGYDSVDWYSINVPDPGANKAPLIWANISTMSPSATFYIYFYDSDMNYLDDAYFMASASVHSGEFSALGDKGGTYYIKVSLSSGNGDVSYTIRAWSTEVNVDDNNDFGNATAVNNGQTVNGDVNYKYDKYDYYKIDVPSPAAGKKMFISAQVTVTGDNTLYVYVYDPDKAIVGSAVANSAYSGTGNTVTAGGECEITPGTYYIKIYTYSDETVSYSLTVTLEELASDGNDDLANATAIALDETHTESMDSIKDKYDCFKIDLQPSTDETIKRYFVVNITSTSVTYAKAYIYNSTDGSALTYNSESDEGGVSFEVRFWIKEAGTYYIKVYAYQGSGDVSTRPYYDDIVSDGNDDIPYADPVSMDDTVTGDVDRETDRYDVYKIYMRDGDRLELDMSFTNDKADLDLLLYGPDAKSVEDDTPLKSSAATGSKPEQIYINITSTGFYYIAVKAYSGSSSYTLEIGGQGNHLAEATLTAPVNGTTVTEEPVVLRWTGTDSDGDNLKYTVMYGTNASSLFVAATGITATTYSLSGLDDGTTYYWTVVPNDGVVDGLCPSGVWQFTTRFNAPPEISDYTPSSTELSLNEGGSITFTVTATDPDGDNLEIKWYLDGTFKTDGDTFTFRPSYDMGGSSYTVKVTVDDGRAKVEKTWTVDVVDHNQPPVLIIDSPANGTEFSIYDEITFDASSSYDADDPTTVMFSWSSDKDGDLGTGKTVTATLSEGTHKITLSGVDGVNTNTTFIYITVKAPELTVETKAGIATAGEKATITATITNNGDVEARDITVTLYDGSKPVAKKTIDTIAAGGSEEVKLSWTPSSAGTKAMKVKVTTGDIEVEETQKVSVAEKSPGFEAVGVMAAVLVTVLAFGMRRKESE